MRGFDRQTVRRAEFFGVISVTLFVGAVALAGAHVGLGAVVSRIGELSVGVIAGLLALSLANYALRIGRWHAFGRHLGLAVPLRRTALYYTAGFTMTTTPGKVGEALRLWLLDRCHGCHYARTAPLLIGDRIGDAAAVLILCLAGIGAFAGYAWATAAVAAAVLLAGFLLVKSRPLLALVAASYRTVGRWPRLFAGLRIALRQTARLFDPPLFALALALGVAGWLAECLALYWLLAEIGAPIGLRAAIFVFAFSMVVGGASMLPGGLGGTEVTMFALLVTAGVPADSALAATAIIRATTLWFAVGLGFAVLPAALRAARAVTADRPELEAKA